MSEIYEHPPENGSQQTTPLPAPAPSASVAEKFKKLFRLVAGLVMAIGYLITIAQIAGTSNFSTTTFYLLLVALMAVLAVANWLEVNDGRKPIVALLVVMTFLIIINSIWPGASVKSAYESFFMTAVVYLDKDEKNETIDIPDRTTVQFKSNKRFTILERRGTSPDGSYILEPVKMPPGKSERYFTWGGNIVLQGLYDGTVLKVSY